MQRAFLRYLTSAALLLAGAGLAYVVLGDHSISPAQPASAADSAPRITASAPPLALPDFAAIVAQNGPAVVNISVAGSARATGMLQIDPDNPFFDFFRRFQAPRGRTPIRGQGSGFIVSSDGVVLTNAHVVADANEVIVKLTDRREFRAKVVGFDRLTDVAVLKIDGRGLPSVRAGDPQRMRVGDWVLAIGSPFGFENSVTAGIISAD
jgi:serine protease Do